MASHFTTSLVVPPPSPRERSPAMKRKRSHNVSVRLSDEEYERLQYKLSHSGLTLTEFLINAINGQKINYVKGYIPLIAELKRHGNNLNQLTHRINEYSEVTQQEINNTLQECRECYKKIYQMTVKVTNLILGD